MVGGIEKRRRKGCTGGERFGEKEFNLSTVIKSVGLSAKTEV